MVCFVGLMRGEILPDRCNQCQPPAISGDSATTAATDISSAIEARL